MANILTLFRIVCAMLLLFCPVFSRGFSIFYILGGISDVLDGFVARHFGKETPLGARLDTIGDMAFTGVVLVKLWRTVFLPRWLQIWIACIGLVKGFNILSGFRRFGRFMAEHTPANKLCGVLLFAVPLCIGRFPWQPVAILIILCCAAASFAAIQEGHYIRKGKEEK